LPGLNVTLPGTDDIGLRLTLERQRKSLDHAIDQRNPRRLFRSRDLIELFAHRFQRVEATIGFEMNLRRRGA